MDDIKTIAVRMEYFGTIWVLAYPRGPFLAVHPTVLGGGWALSHLPTGKTLGKHLSREQAEELAELVVSTATGTLDTECEEEALENIDTEKVLAFRKKCRAEEDIGA